MKHLATLLLLVPISGCSENVKWVDDSAVVADIDCDGTQDQSKIGYQNSNVILSVTLGGSDHEQLLSFGLGSGTRQDSLCGATASLSKEIPPQNNDDTFTYGLGAIPDGHIYRQGCFDLNLSGGECDSIHIYWNHNKNKLYWWRL